MLCTLNHTLAAAPTRSKRVSAVTKMLFNMESAVNKGLLINGDTTTKQSTCEKLTQHSHNVQYFAFPQQQWLR